MKLNDRHHCQKTTGIEIHPVEFDTLEAALTHIKGWFGIHAYTRVKATWDELVLEHGEAKLLHACMIRENWVMLKVNDGKFMVTAS